MPDDSLTAVVIGATISATSTVIVGGCDAAQEVLTSLDDTVIIDWYIGDGERAEADDVVCKLVGPEQVLKGGADPLLDTLQKASKGEPGTTRFAISYRIY